MEFNVFDYLKRDVTQEMLSHTHLHKLLGDKELDWYLVKNDLFSKDKILHYCIHLNLWSTSRILFYHMKNKQNALYPGAKKFIEYIVYAIHSTAFQALSFYLDYFIVYVLQHQSEILDSCLKYVNRKSRKLSKENKQQRLMMFYNVFIRCLSKHNHNHVIQWDNMAMYVFDCDSNSTKLMDRLCEDGLVDEWLKLEYEDTSRFYSTYPVTISLAKRLITLNINIRNNMLHTLLNTSLSHSECLEVLKAIQEKHGDKLFRSVINTKHVTKAISINDIELSRFILSCCEQCYKEWAIMDIIKDKNITAISNIRQILGNTHLNYVTLDLHRFYKPPTHSLQETDNIRTVVDFINDYKVVINADADAWLMLAIDMNDITMAIQVLEYSIPLHDLHYAFDFALAMRRTNICVHILSKMDAIRMRKK
jgi:hypothetical protein